MTLPKIEPVSITNDQNQTQMQQPMTLPKIEPVTMNSNENQQPITLPKIEPVIASENPEIKMNDIKIEPIVNAEVVDKSPIMIEDNADDSSASHTSRTSENESHDTSGHSMLSDNNGMSMHSGDLDLHHVEQSHSNVSEDHLAFNPSELSNEDVETVHVDADKVNDDMGQEVILGDDHSEQSENKSMIII
jgi:hypothetical protein